MANTGRKYTFFDKGAEALRRTLGEEPFTDESGTYHPTYVCPLCLTAFWGKAVEEEDGELTLEHAVEESRGGREILLTCKKCNNRSGSQLGRHAKLREKVRRFEEAITGARDGETFRIRLDPGHEGQDVGALATFTRREDGSPHIRINVLQDHSNPEHLATFSDKMESASEVDGIPDLSFGVQWRPGYIANRARVADLRSAYLVAFALLGYRWLLTNPSLDKVRRQIQEPDEEVLSGYMFAPPENLDSGRRVVLIKEPEPLIWIQLDREGVFLPPIQGRADFYEHMLEEYFGTNLNLRGHEVQWPTKLEMFADFRDAPYEGPE